MRKKEFEICVRAVIRQGKKILVCQHKDKSKNYYFFPGGHLDFGESVTEALAREIKEELNINIEKHSFIGLVDNIFIQENEPHHEFNLVFSALVDKITEQSKEDHLEFILMDVEQLSRENILPLALKKAVIKWLADKKFFWASQIYNKFTLH